MKLELHYDSEDTGGGGEWAALYVDGKLDCVGDAYLAEKRALKLASVEVVHDSAFMLGQHQREGVAKTLDEVYNYRAEREVAVATAARLREEARALLEQADRLTG